MLRLVVFLVVDVEAGAGCWKGEEAACAVLFLALDVEAGARGSGLLPKIGKDGDPSSALFEDDRALTDDLRFRCLFGGDGELASRCEVGRA